jgi:alpha-glucosidase
MNRLAICLVLSCTFLGVEARSEDAGKSPVWLDSAPLGPQNLVFDLGDGAAVRVDVLGECLFRIRHSKTGQWTESALNRYGILNAAFPTVAVQRTEANGIVTLATRQARLSVGRKDGTVALATAGGKTLTEQASASYQPRGGYDLRFTLAKGERLYGLGDVSRENIMRRGGAYELWVLNVKSYIPIPMVLSNRGWGLLMNTTWRNSMDVGKSDPDRLICTAPRSDVDYYLFCGADYRGLLETYTSLTGRPALLPIWGYGLTYVCNQNIDAFSMMNEAVGFRREQIPCDVIGLEPGWMSKNYDFSTEKAWHPQRFPIPHWAPKGPHTFLGALKRKGFKLSLWLCCDYDLGVYEEQQLAGKDAAAPGAKGTRQGATVNVQEGFADERLSKPDGAKTQSAAPDGAAPQAPEPWFEHLKKFVDQGVAAFKLDGAAQVIEHPTRHWGNGMTDEEMHNLYPVIYAKQMARGFEQHTQRRAMVYSAGGYTGVQQFVATWAGDTGGGPRPLASMLNLAFSGHSNHSCDMSVTDVEGIHFGFLQTWAQQNNWDYWYQPWYLEKVHTDAYRQYAQLRYKLLPYLYSTAAEAALTGYPVMRAMSMTYPEDSAWDTCLSQYMLGDFLLVSAFSRQLRLPPGEWIDFWSGKRITGPATLPIEITPSRGGALMVKSGAILPTWPAYDHVEKGWSPQVSLLVYPSAQSSFTLYEDDGQSLGYRKGQFACTPLICKTEGSTITLTIGPRDGKYAGMPATRHFTATIHLPHRPKTVKLDGAPLADCPWDKEGSVLTVPVPGCGAAPRVVTIE